MQEDRRHNDEKNVEKRVDALKHELEVANEPVSVQQKLRRQHVSPEIQAFRTGIEI